MLHSKLIRGGLIGLCCVLAAPLFGQYGYPLKGTFSGDWWLEKGKEKHVLLEFNYDGTKDLVTGTLNPGPEGIQLQKLKVTPPPNVVAEGAKPWIVVFEADGKDETGKPVHYTVEGKLENIGAFNKHFSGVWTVNGQKGEFKTIMQ